MKKTLSLMAILTFTIFTSGCFTITAELKDISSNLSTKNSIDLPVTSESMAKQKLTKLETSKITIKIDAVDFIAEYDENEVAAKKKYEGKNIKITGEIESVGEDVLDDVYVSLAGDDSTWSTVLCYFESSIEIDKVALLKTGDVISIAGTVTDGVLSASLEYCVITAMPPENDT